LDKSIKAQITQYQDRHEALPSNLVILNKLFMSMNTLKQTKLNPSSVLQAYLKFKNMSKLYGHIDSNNPADSICSLMEFLEKNPEIKEILNLRSGKMHIPRNTSGQNIIDKIIQADAIRIELETATQELREFQTLQAEKSAAQRSSTSIDSISPLYTGSPTQSRSR
jgi:hypothetical protein